MKIHAKFPSGSYCFGAAQPPAGAHAQQPACALFHVPRESGPWHAHLAGLRRIDPHRQRRENQRPVGHATEHHALAELPNVLVRDLGAGRPPGLGAPAAGVGRVGAECREASAVVDDEQAEERLAGAGRRGRRRRRAARRRRTPACRYRTEAEAGPVMGLQTQSSSPWARPSCRSSRTRRPLRAETTRECWKKPGSTTPWKASRSEGLREPRNWAPEGTGTKQGCSETAA